MKTKILSLLSGIAILAGLTACQDPHEFSPVKQNEQFDSMTAKFYDDDRDENSFQAEFDYENKVITIVIPYTYPANSDSYLEAADITHMNMTCQLKTGLVLTPALTSMDLSKDNYVTVTDNTGVQTRYTIRGEIRKSRACEILDLSIPEVGVSGVINPNDLTIKLVTAEDLGTQLAAVEVSHGATLSPDPRVEAINWDEEPVITCIAQDGVTKANYKCVKATPDKRPFGIRPGSAKIVWAKKSKDLGLVAYTDAQLSVDPNRFNGSAGLGVVGDYLVINDAGTNKAYYVNYKNGAVAGTIDLSAMGKNLQGNGNNHRMTGDNHGNLLFASSQFQNNNTLTLWRMKGIDGKLEKLVIYNNYQAMGNTLSVTGDIYGDAVITTGSNGDRNAIYRWTLKGGKLVSETPVTFYPGGYTGTCWGTMDAVYTEEGNPESDYFVIGYCAFAKNPPMANVANAETRTCSLHDGLTHELKSYGSFCITSNSVENAGAFIKFNNSKYFIHNIVNTLGYGYGASLVMYDVTDGTLDTQAIKFDGTDVALRNNYGVAAAGNGSKDRGGNGNDVHFYVSPDGFYLYIFFEYSNGYVGCVRCDCIDM